MTDLDRFRMLAFLRLLGIFFVLLANASLAQTQQKGDASLRVEYQYIRTGSFLSGSQEFDYWTTDTQVAMLSGDYAINDRWTVFAALPYVGKRFNSEVPWGGDPHNPNDPYWVDFVPPDKRFWDDGKYHSAFQDLSIGVNYLIQKGPWTLRPYINYGVPASNYPFFAKAAIGKNLWTVPVGMSFYYVPYFSDWHFGGNACLCVLRKAAWRQRQLLAGRSVGRLLVQGQPLGRSVPEPEICPGRTLSAVPGIY